MSKAKYFEALKSEERKPSPFDNMVRVKTEDLRALKDGRVTITLVEKCHNAKAERPEDADWYNCTVAQIPGAYFTSTSILLEKLDIMVETAGSIEQLNADFSDMGGFSFQLVERKSRNNRSYFDWVALAD